MDLTQYLVSEKIVEPDTMSQAKRIAQAQNISILSALFELGIISSERRAEISSHVLGVDIASVENLPKQPILPSVLPSDFLARVQCLPLQEEGCDLLVAFVDPFDDALRQTLRVAAQRNIVPMVIDSNLMAQAYDVLYGQAASSEAEQKTYHNEQVLNDSLEEVVNQAPIIRLAKSMLDDAVRARASDIHIEPFKTQLIVRMRIDGKLLDMSGPELTLAAALTSRLKVMAGLNIAERRLPQDGRFAHVCDGRRIDVRVSTAPTQFGESVVLRLLDNKHSLSNFHNLGMAPNVQTKFKRLLAASSGLGLLNGPTGSGKSTTLYTAMKVLSTEDRKIISIEDPIEYEVHAVNQMAVKPEIGLDFASLLRSALRQDPDVILVGEIRDPETAEIASRAALTGHLVLSTLHTNTALGAITRLRDMGVPPYVLAASMKASVSQRLVRKFCTACGCHRSTTQKERSLFEHHLGIDVNTVALSSQMGCDQCNRSGYAGRIAIYDAVIVGNSLKNAIASDLSEFEMRDQLKEGDGLVKAALQKVADGTTTLEEVSYIIGDPSERI